MKIQKQKDYGCLPPLFLAAFAGVISFLIERFDEVVVNSLWPLSNSNSHIRSFIMMIILFVPVGIWFERWAEKRAEERIKDEKAAGEALRELEERFDKE